MRALRPAIDDRGSGERTFRAAEACAPTAPCRDRLPSASATYGPAAGRAARATLRAAVRARELRADGDSADGNDRARRDAARDHRRRAWRRSPQRSGRYCDGSRNREPQNRSRWRPPAVHRHRGSFVFGHRAAGKRVRADDHVRPLAQHQRAQVACGELVRPSSKAPDFGRSLGAIVNVPVHLRNGLDHPQISVGDDARDDQRGILVRIDDRCLRVRRSSRSAAATAFAAETCPTPTLAERKRTRISLGLRSFAASLVVLGADARKSSRISCASPRRRADCRRGRSR